MNKRLLDRRVKLERLTPRWEPKEWRPEYDQIVLLSVYGHSNINIASVYNLTPQQVSNILNCEKGKEVENKLRVEVLEQKKQDIGGRLERISIKAVDVIEQVIDKKHVIEDLVENHPLSLLNNMMNVLKATGKVKDNNAPNSTNSSSPAINLTQITVNQQNNNVTVPIQFAERINSGLAMLNEIDRIHNNNVNKSDSSK